MESRKALGTDQNRSRAEPVGQDRGPRARHHPGELRGSDQADHENGMRDLVGHQDLSGALQPRAEVQYQAAEKIAAEVRLVQYLPGGSRTNLAIRLHGSCRFSWSGLARSLVAVLRPDVHWWSPDLFGPPSPRSWPS